MGEARQLKVTYLKTGKSQNISFTFSSLAEEMYQNLMRDPNVKVELIFPADRQKIEALKHIETTKTHGN